MNKTIIVVCLLMSVVFACRGKPNTYPVIDPNFTKSEVHQFGEKYSYFNSDLNQSYFILRLWGNSYQAGLAYGSLMKNEIKNLVRDLWSYYHSLAE